MATASVFGAFSLSLVVMALAGPPVGRAIDRAGGRGVLVLSSAVLAAGLVAARLRRRRRDALRRLAACSGSAWRWDSTTRRSRRWCGSTVRKRGAPITGITLIAGFASTVGWPLTAFLAERYGWRNCCFVWAGLNLALCLPLYHMVSQCAAPSGAARGGEGRGGAGRGIDSGDAAHVRAARGWFAATAFVTSALAAHLPRLLLAAGATAAVALLASTLLGPAQVAARLAEFFAIQRWRFHPLLTARIATGMLPAAGAVLALFGGPAFAACAFAVVHGAGNGMITIAKGTLPLALFGPVGYGYRQGLLAILARAMQALAPFVFAVTLDGLGAQRGDRALCGDGARRTRRAARAACTGGLDCENGSVAPRR